MPRVNLEKNAFFVTEKEKYQILEPIGQGGSGCVWKLKNTEGNFFALKIFSPIKSVEEKEGKHLVKKRFIDEICALEAMCPFGEHVCF